MVRHYKRKTNKASYSKDKLLEAIAAVKNGDLSAYRESIVYGVPRPTIVNRLYDRRGLKSTTLGRSTLLPKEVEETLARNLHTIERYGFVLTRKEVLELVGQYVTSGFAADLLLDGVLPLRLTGQFAAQLTDIKVTAAVGTFMQKTGHIVRVQVNALKADAGAAKVQMKVQFDDLAAAKLIKDALRIFPDQSYLAKLEKEFGEAVLNLVIKEINQVLLSLSVEEIRHLLLP